MSFKGAKATEEQKQFSQLRNAINTEKLLPRHLKLMQPKYHFFERLSERNVDTLEVLRILSEVPMKYAKRIAVDKPTDFTLMRGKLGVGVVIEPCDKRIIGHLDDGLPTMVITPVTVFKDNGIGGTRTNLLRI